MNKELLVWEFAGLLFTLFAGSLLHFVYKWSGRKTAVGLFSPVNESTWEHLKLIFFPALIFSVAEYFFVGYKYNNYFSAKAMGLLFGLIAIVVSFYTYTGIVGANFLWMDILTFVLGTAVFFCYTYLYLSRHSNTALNTSLQGGILLALLFVCFAVFTFLPPRIALFLDPVTKSYGIANTKR